MNTIILKHGIWVLVADGEKALLLKNAGDTKFPNLEVVQVMEQENPPTREQGSDSPGRYNDGPSVHRSAVE
ncbi:Host attachment protein, partial [bacterium M00.F.Ca.ET.180.01.1.1]